MNDFRENLRNKLNKYIKLNNYTYRSFKNNGLGDMSETIKSGSTRFANLFNIANFLRVDIRNLLMFSDDEYEFENSFSNFEEFFLYMRTKFKNYRQKKGLKVSDIDKEITAIYRFESGKKMISLKKFYSLLGVMGITPDEFFLDDVDENNYEIKKENKEISDDITKDEYVNVARYSILLSLEDIFRRVDELEEIRGVKIAKSVIPTRTVMPTVHVFLNICKSLKISPSDFFDFSNKNPDYTKNKIDNRQYINIIRNIIKANNAYAPKFLRLDNISDNVKDMKCFFEKFSQVVSILERENFDNFEKIDDICTAVGMPQNGGFKYMKLNFIEMEKFADGVEKGKEIGKVEGLQEERTESIRKIIKVMRSLNIDEDSIIKKIEEEYGLSRDDIKKYM